MRIMNYGNDYSHRDKMSEVHVEERQAEVAEVAESQEVQAEGEGKTEAKKRGRKSA